MSTAETQVIPLAIRTMEEAGRGADASAAQHLLREKARRLAEETLRRHRFDLARFAQYLAEAQIHTGDFLQDVEAWRGLTWGICAGLRRVATPARLCAWQYQCAPLDRQILCVTRHAGGDHFG